MFSHFANTIACNFTRAKYRTLVCAYALTGAASIREAVFEMMSLA